MQPYNVYAIGQTALLEGMTTDEDEQPAAPSNPRILLLPPSGTETSLEVSYGEVGSWFHRLRITGPPGFYTYRLVTDDDADERIFYVRESAFSSPLG